MMKSVSFFALSISLICVSCNTNHVESIDSSSISIDIDNCQDLETQSFIDKIEIISLETNDNCLLDQYDQVVYCEDLNAYLIIDEQQTVSLFSENGEFIADSKNCRGKGPKEYQILADANYNPFTKSIDILSPYGTIYSYNTDFKFIQKRVLNSDNHQTYSKGYPIGKNKYILQPTILKANDATLHFCDYEKNEIIAINSYEKDFICSLSLGYPPFFKKNGDLYFSPNNLNYHIYKVDTKENKLTPAINFSIENGMISKEELINRFGNMSATQTDRNTLEKTIQTLNNVTTYLLGSEYPIPLIKLCNDSYLYLYMMKKGKRMTVLYDRTNGVTLLQTDKHKKRLSYCTHLEGNTLTAIIQPEEIEKYIDTNLLDDENKKKLQAVQEDDNPIIVKYQIKE